MNELKIDPELKDYYHHLQMKNLNNLKKIFLIMDLTRTSQLWNGMDI